ncbi:MAG: hypothetical protein QGH59_10000, partial [Gemmatimonadota bacterium]|nr:hypothetical protein [Gemmatimonadota bacterium]
AGDVVLLDAPAPLPGAATLVDSDEAVTRALGIADSLNTVAPGTIPEASTFSARLLSYPVWPEPGTVYATTDSIAWRVDLMTYREYGGEEGAPPESTYFSLARFYLSPTTGLLLDDGESPNPVVHEEIYPFP